MNSPEAGSEALSPSCGGECRRGGHNWSGWPGAYCMRCNMPDPVEEAIGASLMEPWDGTWASDEAQVVCEYLAANCPADLPESEMPKFNDMVRRYNALMQL